MNLDAFRTRLIEQGAFEAEVLAVNLFAHNAVGDTLLHSAVYHDLPEVVEHLLQLGAPIEARGEYGFTPLHVAAFRGNVRIATLLLSAGANREVRSEWGESPLHLAHQNRHPELIRLLEAV